MSVRSVVVVGDVNVDVIARHLEPLHARSDTEATVTLSGGGSAANTACWLVELAARGAPEPAPVVLVAAVGDDALADLARRALDDAGVHWLGATVPGTATGACVVLVDGRGERTMLPQRGANDRLPEHVVVEAVAATRPAWVHLSGYALLHPGSRPAGLGALRQARATGATRSVDVASAAPLAAVGAAAVLDWIDGVDVVFANEDELSVLGGEAAVASRVGCVVAKRGAAGAGWCAGPRRGRGAAHHAEVLDTTGAGDAFAAGWIAAAVGGAGPDEALERALAAGARAVAQIGARPVPPGGSR